MITHNTVPYLDKKIMAAYKVMGDGYEKSYLYYMAQRSSKILEIGTGAGGGTLLMSRGVQDSGKPGEVHSIGYEPVDKDYRVNLNRISAHPDLKARITLYYGKSQDLVEKFQNEYFDFIYVDGDHSYEGVKADIKNYWPKLKKGGVMAFHDTNQEYVQKAISEELKGKVQVADVSRIKAYLK